MREPDGPISAEQILEGFRRFERQQKREAFVSSIAKLVGLLVSLGLISAAAGYGWTLGVRLAGG